MQDQSNKIYIRVDGSAEIGLGHLVRCVALACMLKHEFSICFTCKELPESIFKEISNEGFNLLMIKNEQEFLELLKGNEIVVLDHYGLDSYYQKNIKETGCKLVCIDDLHEGKFYADLIINHAPSITVENYDAQYYTQFALGLDFALLRPVFLRAAKSEAIKSEKNVILINFGGADPRNLSLSILKDILDFDEIDKINIVVGGVNQNIATIKDFVLNYPRVEVFYSINEHKMLELMVSASIIIVPSSGVLLECLTVGNIIISGFYIENQINLYKGYKELNAFIDANNFTDIKKAIVEALKFNKPINKLIDGNSGNRILKLFQQLVLEQNVVMRKADDNDTNLTYGWASDKIIRAFSFTQNDIKFYEHESWFLKKINSNNCFYYIAEINSSPIGSIRFDINDDEAIISYLIDSSHHSKGFGIILLKKGITKLISESEADFKKVAGFVMPENIASCKAFERLYFKKTIDNKYYKYILKDENR